MIDLSLISMEELIGEIKKRTDGMIIGYTILRNGKEEHALFQFHGSKFTAVGLARCLEDRIKQDIVDSPEIER